MTQTKSVLLIFMGLSAAIPCLSQTLQFSDVKLVTSAQTVPAGKVWKITNMLPNSRLSSSAATNNAVSTNNFQTATASSEQAILVNDETIFLATSNSSMRQVAGGSTPNGMSIGSNATSGSAQISPIWLPAGTTLAAGTGVYALSVIEFTVQ